MEDISETNGKWNKCMGHSKGVNVHNISYEFSASEALFSGISLSISDQKIGLIGDNGVGKSTLLKMIVGDLLPTKGIIEKNIKIEYLPQNINFRRDDSIAELLGIEQKIQAIREIKKGCTETKYFEIVGDDWDIEQRALNEMSHLKMPALDLNRQVKSFSGGELTWLMLTRLKLSRPGLIILDEPSNNLDHHMRQVLYQFIQSWPKGMLVASHDRALLEYMDQIAEMTNHALRLYGGNFTFYSEQKVIEQNAIEKTVKAAKRALEINKQSAQKTIEKKQKTDAKGGKNRRSGSQPKIVLNAQQSRSEKTHKSLLKKIDNKLERSQNRLNAAKSQIEDFEDINFSISTETGSKNKYVLEIEHLDFGYCNSRPMFIDFNLLLKHGERLLLEGENGSGKSTLINLILGQLQPTRGTIKTKPGRLIVYDQFSSFLDLDKSILDNFKKYNPSATETHNRLQLAEVGFRKNSVLRNISDLSGGERTRVALTCLLMGERSPELLILDEPTNHMDLKSIASITQALNNFNGAMILISHDEKFINDLILDKKIRITLRNYK